MGEVYLVLGDLGYYLGVRYTATTTGAAGVHVKNIVTPAVDGRASDIGPFTSRDIQIHTGTVGDVRAAFTTDVDIVGLVPQMLIVKAPGMAGQLAAGRVAGESRPEYTESRRMHKVEDAVVPHTMVTGNHKAVS